MTHYRPVKSTSSAALQNNDNSNAYYGGNNEPSTIESSPTKFTTSNAFYKEKIDIESNHRDDDYLSNDKISSSASSRPVIIFGSIDLSHLSAVLQYSILSAGLLLFMCLYGYYQELVAYSYFERKLTIFSTFLHFLGCWLVAYGQRRSITPSKHHHIGILLSMGSAPSKLAIFYYALLISLKTLSQGLTNMSMTQINYPAKVLFKSATPIINMIIGLFWFRRSYPLRDYFVVILLVVGLYVFVNADSNSSPEGTKYGIILVTVAMFCGGK
jgi:hypothetical protein